MRLYVILRQDVFDALALGQLKETSFMQVGPLWAIVRLTEEERRNYRFAIAENTP